MDNKTYFEHQLPREKRCVLHALNNVLARGEKDVITCDDFVTIVDHFFKMPKMINSVAKYSLCSKATDGVCTQDSWSFSVALKWLELNVQRKNNTIPVYKELKNVDNDPTVLFTEKGHYYMFVQLKKDEHGMNYKHKSDWSNHAICVVDFNLFDSLEDPKNPPINLNPEKNRTNLDGEKWNIQNFKNNYYLKAIWKINWPLKYIKK